MNLLIYLQNATPKKYVTTKRNIWEMQLCKGPPKNTAEDWKLFDLEHMLFYVLKAEGIIFFQLLFDDKQKWILYNLRVNILSLLSYPTSFAATESNQLCIEFLEFYGLLLCSGTCCSTWCLFNEWIGSHFVQKHLQNK